MTATAVRAHRASDRLDVRNAARTVGLLAAAALLVAFGFETGRLLAPPPSPADPISYVHGIPVGVVHSPGGALAAADSYVLVEQESVEQNPPREGRLIAIDDAPSYRAADARSAAEIRSEDRAGMAFLAHGGRSFAFVGARRLDYYGGSAAQVTTWRTQIFWGAGEPRTPTQAWGLDQTSLEWSSGRWLVTRNITLQDSAPAPALTAQSDPSNTAAPLFASQLAGFAPPSYDGATQ